MRIRVFRRRPVWRVRPTAGYFDHRQVRADSPQLWPTPNLDSAQALSQFMLLRGHGSFRIAARADSRDEVDIFLTQAQIC